MRISMLLKSIRDRQMVIPLTEVSKPLVGLELIGRWALIMFIMHNVDPIANSSSQILLEALQNFVIPLIHAAEGNNKKGKSLHHDRHEFNHLVKKKIL
jgi:hypothetical protein